jgi:hypothetical protein
MIAEQAVSENHKPFQLQAPVEIKPQCPGFTFTHQVSHPTPQIHGNALILISESR